MTSDDWAPLVDLTKENLADLVKNPDDALAKCVERLIKGLEDPNGVISGFGNFAS